VPPHASRGSPATIGNALEGEAHICQRIRFNNMTRSPIDGFSTTLRCRERIQDEFECARFRKPQFIVQDRPSELDVFRPLTRRFCVKPTAERTTPGLRQME